MTDDASGSPVYRIKVTRDNSLEVTGEEGLSFREGESWEVEPLGSGRLVLRNSSHKPRVVSRRGSTFAWVSSGELFDILNGHHDRLWTGMISVETSMGLKFIYFLHGELVFARSGLFDDRLGEVIYRGGELSLDELTNSAAQVDRNRKFGQVLISSGLFDHVKLWEALKSQVYQIVCSVFMETQAGIEFYPDEEPSSEVRFERGTREFLDRCYSFGCMYQGFTGRITEKTEVHLTNVGQAAVQYPAGTFLGDLICLLETADSVDALLKVSKLKAPYTLMGLMLLMNEGLCRLDKLEPVRLPEGRSYLLPLKSKMNIYEFLLNEVHKVFDSKEKKFPVVDLQLMARTLNEDKHPVLFLNKDGLIHPESVHHIFYQCLAVRSRVIYFEAVVDSLVRFLLQVVKDRLGPESSGRIVELYRKFTYK